MKETLKQAGYVYVRYSPRLRAHILENQDGELELWTANKNHASYGLIYKNTHLEFASSYQAFYGVPADVCRAVLEG